MHAKHHFELFVGYIIYNILLPQTRQLPPWDPKLCSLKKIVELKSCEILATIIQSSHLTGE